MTENEQKITTVFFYLQEYVQRSRNAGTRMYLFIFFSSLQQTTSSWFLINYFVDNW